MIVSGGQTGVDRAALDFALQAGIPCGGWCPRGRLAEDGVIDARYPLRETGGAGYGERTRANVRDSDATLIICDGKPSGGTALTERTAIELGRPVLVVQVQDVPGAGETGAWLQANAVRILNVAGPRESGSPGIHARAFRLLSEWF